MRFGAVPASQIERVTYKPEEIIDLADGRLLLLGRVKGSGLSSGAGFDNEFAAIYTLSAGRIIRDHAFFNHAEALEAAGLSRSSN